jgi:hypothetical protein
MAVGNAATDVVPVASQARLRERLCNITFYPRGAPWACMIVPCGDEDSPTAQQHDSRGKISRIRCVNVTRSLKGSNVNNGRS